MSKAIIFLKLALIKASANNDLINHIFRHKKYGTPATIVCAIIAALLLYSLLLLVFRIRKVYIIKKYRLDSLAEIGLLNRKIIGLNEKKKQITEYELPIPRRHGHILELKNVNPALKKEDVVAKREQLERIYFSIFRSEIAEINLVERRFLWTKRTDLVLVFGSIPNKFSFAEIKNKNKFAITLGRAAFREITWDLTTKSTSLILGAMGSGKSVLISSIATQLLYKPFRVKIILATGKDPIEDFPQFENHPDVKLLCHATEHGYNELISEIRNLVEMDKPRMSEKLKKEGVKKWFELKEPELKIVIIDEAFVLASNKNWKDDVKLYSDMISLSRSSGSGFSIIGSQGQRSEEFSKIGIDPDRFLIRVGSKVSTPQLSQTLYNDRDIGCDDTLSHGKMIYSEGRNPTRIRAVYSDDIKEFPRHPWHNSSENIAAKIDVHVESIVVIDADANPSSNGVTANKLSRFKRKG